MSISEHPVALSDFIECQQNMTLEEKRSDFDRIFKLIRRFQTLDANTKILEIGTGVGWLVLLCETSGLKCKGIEVNPELAQYAHRFGRQYGVTPDIQVGNIENDDIGTQQYDVIVATSTFEHVRNWETGLRKAFNALKPGGLFYFYSTNKFAFHQGEYKLPLYSWLPDRWRYNLRRSKQGDSIMEWGIDFNQFTYFQLRRFFKQLGFSKVLDLVDVLDPENLDHPTRQKQLILRLLKRSKLLKRLALLFSPGTLFICVK